MRTWTLTEEDAAEVLTLIRWASLAGRSKFSQERAQRLYQELSAAEDLPAAANEQVKEWMHEEYKERYDGLTDELARLRDMLPEGLMDEYQEDENASNPLWFVGNMIHLAKENLSN